MVSSFLLPGVIVVGVIVVIVAFISMAKNYIKVPPEQAAVIYGRKHKVKGPDGSMRERGFRLVRGGAAFVWPFFEKVSWLDLSLITIQLQVQKVPSKDGVPVNVDAIANVKIGSTDDALEKAAEQFGGKSLNQIEDTIKETMEGHLRAIVGRLTPEELYQDRQKFSQEVQNAATEDIASMGFEIVTFPVKDVRDSEGYIEALGKKRVAEVKKEAAIGEANAKRDELKQTSEALREGKEAELRNQEAVAEAERNLAIKRAKYKAETDTEQAKAAQAGPLAEAEALKGVNKAKVAAEEAETEARIGLAEKEALRTEKALIAEVIKPAEAQKQKTIIDAKAKEDAAESLAKAIRVQADAEREKREKEGQGEAAAIEAKGVAEAKADEAKRKAVAAGKEADLLAEAKGKRELAEALAKLDETGRLLQVLEAAPKVADAVGDALAKALGPEGLAAVFGQIAAPMASIDEIKILDMGGGNGKDGNAVSRLAGVGPDIFFKFLANMKAMGMDGMLRKFGISSDLVDQFVSALGSGDTASAGETLKKVGEAIHVASSPAAAGTAKEASAASAQEKKGPAPADAGSAAKK